VSGRCQTRRVPALAARPVLNWYYGSAPLIRPGERPRGACSKLNLAIYMVSYADATIADNCFERMQYRLACSLASACGQVCPAFGWAQALLCFRLHICQTPSALTLTCTEPAPEMTCSTDAANPRFASSFVPLQIAMLSIVHS
jgi:hypothetical protein